MSQILKALLNLMYQPLKVLTFCLVVTFLVLVVEGSFWRLWSLYSEKNQMQEQMLKVKQAQLSTAKKINEAQQSYFIEYLAREKFHMVEEGDLIFIFPEDEAE